MVFGAGIIFPEGETC